LLVSLLKRKSPKWRSDQLRVRKMAAEKMAPKRLNWILSAVVFSSAAAPTGS